ncbi:hypothetical protein [Morganella sp. EGD-HP17]|uniref:hypothetical protein n=1 Tax=Morganella sp. EGD-HP17 TaxID=1435146 RepID=UPI00044DBCFF|nr:hypothetical protein [Morganella sp. EGD-HP17]ETO41468.1 hypothetical protein X965_08010 [Morganella sp. EGD-HP17]
MKLLPLIFSVFLFGCASADNSQLKDKPKEDPYAESTLNTIKASQEAYRELQRQRYGF